MNINNGLEKELTLVFIFSLTKCRKCLRLHNSLKINYERRNKRKKNKNEITREKFWEELTAYFVFNYNLSI
jgi:hypothetical protein